MQFQTKLINWFDTFGRKHLPWQQEVTPYKVWISEVMLQQTQVATVIPYFERFMKAYPTPSALAKAPLDHVLHQWTGLGYYSRARNLHKSAQIITEKHQGQFPDNYEDIIALPGIGRSTAGAILSLGLKKPYAILDGNVKRVLTRTHGIFGYPEKTDIKKQLWTLSEALLDKTAPHKFNQAMMDLGATLCTRQNPDCPNCPVQENCQARATQQIHLLPTKKPKKAKPTKKEQVIIISNFRQTAILLYKRKEEGIWGGLWSLPNFDSCSALAPLFKSVDVTKALSHPEKISHITHQFTHFTLKLECFHCKITAPNLTQLGRDDLLWYNLSQPQQIGLPRPIVTLIEDFQHEQNDSMCEAQRAG